MGVIPRLQSGLDYSQMQASSNITGKPLWFFVEHRTTHRLRLEMTVYAVAGFPWDRHHSRRPASNHLRSDTGAAESEICATLQSECGHFAALTRSISLFVKTPRGSLLRSWSRNGHHLGVLLNRQDPKPSYRPMELESACQQDLCETTRKVRSSKTLMVWLHH